MMETPARRVHMQSQTEPKESAEVRRLSLSDKYQADLGNPLGARCRIVRGGSYGAAPALPNFDLGDHSSRRQR